MIRGLVTWMGLGCAGCAALTPIDGPPPAIEAPAIELQVVELRPTAVVLEARGLPAKRIELWRDVGEGPQLLQATDLDASQSSSLTSGATLIDQSPTNVPAVYTLVAVDLHDAPHLARATVAWTPAPDAPTITPRYMPGIGVRLEWDGPSGCLVLRRDVIANDTWAIVQRSASCHGAFVDTSTAPGGVYAYRVATADWQSGYPRYSQPSPEVYVTAHATETD